MDLTIAITTRHVMRALGAVIVTLAVLGLAAKIVRAFSDHWVVRRFDLSAEWTFASIFSAGMLATAFVITALIAAHTRRQNGRFVGHWRGLALLFLYLSLDELLAVHERLSDPVRLLIPATSALARPWVIPAVLAVVVVVLLYLRFLAQLPRGTRRGLVLAGTLLVGGAIGGDVAAGYVDGIVLVGRFDLLATVRVIAEETLEMLGAAILIGTLLDWLVAGTDFVSLSLLIRGRAGPSA